MLGFHILTMEGSLRKIKPFVSSLIADVSPSSASDPAAPQSRHISHIHQRSSVDPSHRGSSDEALLAHEFRPSECFHRPTRSGASPSRPVHHTLPSSVIRGFLRISDEAPQSRSSGRESSLGLFDITLTTAITNLMITRYEGLTSASTLLIISTPQHRSSPGRPRRCASSLIQCSSTLLRYHWVRRLASTTLPLLRWT